MTSVHRNLRETRKVRGIAQRGYPQFREVRKPRVGCTALQKIAGVEHRASQAERYRYELQSICRYDSDMPNARRPLASAPAKNAADRTPAERARLAIDRLDHVLGDRSRVKLKVDVVLSRAAAERLMQRALERSDTMNFSVLLASILEGAAEEMDRESATPPKRKGARPA